MLHRKGFQKQEEQIPENHVLVYADAGCELGLTETALSLWKSLLKSALANDLVAFFINEAK